MAVKKGFESLIALLKSFFGLFTFGDIMSKSWKLCPWCAQNAKELIGEQRERVNSLLNSLRESRQDLVEAVALDGKNNKPAQKNLDECNKILSQLEPHTT